MLYHLFSSAGRSTSIAMETDQCYFLCRFVGSAGQSFGCFLTPGINLRLIGEANDGVAKVFHPQDMPLVPL